MKMYYITIFEEDNETIKRQYKCQDLRQLLDIIYKTPLHSKHWQISDFPNDDEENYITL